MKVVIHVGRTDQWKVAVGNSKNLKSIREDAIIEIVVNSGGINLFKTISQELREQLSLLSELNVKIKLCRNALNLYQIIESSLPDGVEVIPAGIVELVERQEEGYAYISP